MKFLFEDGLISSAELIKHASNSFLALKISYANVIANPCERIGGDVEEVTHAMGLDPRIGRNSSRPASASAGSTFPRIFKPSFTSPRPWALSSTC